MLQHGDVVIVAENLREAAREFDTRRELGRPAGRQQLHMAPMMLQCLAPFVEIVGAAAGKGFGQGLTSAAVGLAEALGHRLEPVGIDREAGQGRPDAGETLNRVRSGAAFETACGRLPAFPQPIAQGRDRGSVGIVLGVAKELIDGIEQSVCITGRGKPFGDGAQALGEACIDRLGQARPDQHHERAQSFQALACVVHAFVTVRGNGERGTS